MKQRYKLLTPGPLTTTDTVKEEMLVDHCTWDDEYKEITQTIRRKLLQLAHVDEEQYTTILMQGSGTFGVESVLSSVIGPKDKILIASNGAYGQRIADIAKYNRISYDLYEEPFNEIPKAEIIAQRLDEDPTITHFAMVHSETTSGILNELQDISDLLKERKICFILDAMSSFGGIDLHVGELGISYLISSANKCIQGVPGFSFIIADKKDLMKCEDRGRNLSLNLYDQWKTMEVDGKWRFTSPTHVVLAFAKALEELELEGGIVERAKR
ncbi:MAG TPA: 2-aminoethylphosphonate--pyruvate transaminase, partial [Candidatus Merdenecus merdavium]|nr:2-aminoethylphosphonate--pyruvate transaminase [Candidatus Merdenecus merdavium]